MAEDTARLFVAVEVPEGVRDGLAGAVEPLRRALPEARWVAPGAYHVTLSFIGDVDDDGARRVGEACGEAAAASGGFRLALSGWAGTFGQGVLWAGLADSLALDRLAAGLRDALATHGMTVEQRPFHGHVTLARAGRGAPIRQALAATYDGPRSTWPVERIVVMRSDLRRSGAQYSVEDAWLLGAPPG